MAPVAIATESASDAVAKLKDDLQIFNPFYSPSIGDDGDNTYKFAEYKPSFPDVKWAPLTEKEVTDRGHYADPHKKSLFAAATKVRHLNPSIGTELIGLDLAKLDDKQKDELALLVGERGVVVVRNQSHFAIEQQLDLARHFGPLHKHATTPIPRNGLEEVHVVYNDKSRKPDPSAFSKLELWHSDVTYEIQPPSTTSLKVLTGPEYGGDTLFSSGYSLYSSFSPAFQTYLESLSAVHSGVAQANGAKAAGLPVRREAIETIHPLVRVHPVTGFKSVFANPGFTRRIIGVPKAESDTILNFLFAQIANNPDFQVRVSWNPDGGDIAFWDNRIVTHSASFDFFPATRHALRATPHGERPLSVAAYEKKYGKKAVDRQKLIEAQWEKQGISNPIAPANVLKERGYND